MIRLGIAGIGGRMGQEVAAAAREDPTFRLQGGIVRPASKRALPEGIAAFTDPDMLLPDLDLLIDVSTPAATSEHARRCSEAGVAFVGGVTGLSAGDMAVLRTAAERVPIFYARNFSIGLAAIDAVLPALVRALNGYDVEIVEMHHRRKTDAPSGTAFSLAETIAAALPNSGERSLIFGREGTAARRPGEIALHAIRGGGNPGEHEIIFADDGDEVRVSHRAFSRRTFARGALKAAAFLVEQPPGLYGMADLLYPHFWSTVTEGHRS